MLNRIPDAVVALYRPIADIKISVPIIISIIKSSMLCWLVYYIIMTLLAFIQLLF